MHKYVLSSSNCSLNLTIYELFSKNEQPFVVPTWARVPKSYYHHRRPKWLAQQPPNFLCSRDCTFEKMQFKHTVGYSEIVNEDMLDVLIKQDLSRNIGSFNPET